jgi:hypothetical protein
MQELAELLKRSEAGGDASVMMAQQLIAVLLNIANGAVVTPEMTTAINTAQALLTSFEGKLPYNINSHSELGQVMLDARKELDNVNQSNGPCRPVATTADIGALVAPQGLSVLPVVGGDAGTTEITGCSSTGTNAAGLTAFLLVMLCFARARLMASKNTMGR